MDKLKATKRETHRINVIRELRALTIWTIDCARTAAVITYEFWSEFL